MKALEKNIKNAFGESGTAWLASLPLIIQKLARHWLLTDIQPAKNMSWNYIAYAIQNHSSHIVLKISHDKQLIQNEYRALQYFGREGAIKVIDICYEHHAMLLEQAAPGEVLKNHYPFKIEETIKIYSQVVKTIASKELTNFSFPHVSTWCETIDKINDGRIDPSFVEKAKQLKTALLHSAKYEYLCHGDLHLENIIQRGEDWVVIDPKGIIGEMAFEVAAFDLISKDEMKDSAMVSTKIIYRTQTLSTILGINFDRLLAWIFLRILISAQWFIEDNGDPSQMIELAHYVYPLLKNRDF